MNRALKPKQKVSDNHCLLLGGSSSSTENLSKVLAWPSIPSSVRDPLYNSSQNHGSPPFSEPDMDHLVPKVRGNHFWGKDKHTCAHKKNTATVLLSVITYLANLTRQKIGNCKEEKKTKWGNRNRWKVHVQSSFTFLLEQSLCSSLRTYAC